MPLGYEMKDGKIAIVEEEAELVRSIFRRYLELGSVNELVRDLKERNIRTKSRLLSTGATRGGIPFGRGALYYLLGNHFYIGEVKYKNEILPGEQPPIMDRALFEAVRQKSLAQWSHRTVMRSKADHLLTGLLFDDAGHRMVPTHATKAGIRYRYYVSTPFLHGEAKTASAGSVARVPAPDIEDIVVKFLKEYLAAEQVGRRPALCPYGVAAISHGWLPELLCTGSCSSFNSSRTTQTRDPIPRMTCRSQFPGRSHPPEDPARSCFRTMHLEATPVRHSSNAGRAWSALSHVAVDGWMMLSQVE